MNNRGMVVWFPTLRCNLHCAYCISRTLPVVTHGAEITPAAWARVWETCPWDVDSLNICGGEPALYAGLGEALARNRFGKIHLNTNLVADPKTWWTGGLLGVTSATIGWHLYPGHLLDASTWRHVEWVCANVLDPRASGNHITMCHVRDRQRDRPEDRHAIERRCAALGITYWPLDYDDVWQWRDWLPERGGSATSCSGGVDMTAIMPDASAYRCLSYPYAGRDPLCNLLSDGWGAMPTVATPCNDLLCSNYPICDRVSTVFEGGELPPWKTPKPGRPYTYKGNY
jgi:hypothetical protein